jgi:hypothetical protein
MRALLQLVSKVDEDTVALLKCLAHRAIAGQVTGVALCYRDAKGHDEVMFTGAYAARPADAVNAAMRLSWELTKAQDRMTGPP